MPTPRTPDESLEHEACKEAQPGVFSTIRRRKGEACLVIGRLSAVVV